MRKQVKMAVAMMAAATVAGSLAGCSGGKAETAPVETLKEAASSSEQQEGNSKTAEGEAVTLRMSWWGGDSRHERILAVIDAFQKENPGIVIEPEYSAFADYRDKFTMQLTSGAAADILAVDQPWVSSIMAQGDFFVDLSSYKELGLDNMDSYIIDNFCKSGDGTYFVPAGVNGMGSLVDEEKLSQYGFDITNETFTWNDLIALGEKVHAADENQYLLCVDSKQASLYYARAYLRQLTGKQFINDDGTVGVTKEELAEALGLVNTLFEKGIIQPIEESGIYENSMTQNPSWINRQMFMILGRTSSMTDMSARRADGSGNYTTTGYVFPQLENAKETGIEVRPTTLYAINASSEHPEAAVKFLSFMFNSEEGTELLKDTYSVPASESLRQYCEEKQLLDESSMKNVIYSLENSGNVVNAWSNNSEVEAMMTEIMQKIAYKQFTDMNEAADEVISRIEQIVSTNTTS
ncbi:ABC transporter substrate-binding protein [Lacrimispora sp.]|uniref:ABC transporter substrate-binding protein n=1 Tax=Lacrimispora sp. TaxID=2719234 RepID=UPI0028A5CA39|nr:extracellular solute-binding protein [Lacrimispora sp.]